MSGLSAGTGHGAGVQAPDGCSVELYRQIPYLGELEGVVRLFDKGASVLELGCGTGRLCARLAEAGCVVTGVDESAEMLACVPAGIAAVQSSIQNLSLGRTYDIVLLASHLANHPSAQTREAFVECARRHLDAGGVFVLDRHDPGWLETACAGPAGMAGNIAIAIEDVSRKQQVVQMTLRYELAKQVWRHSFSAAALSEADVEQLLANAGFGGVCWHGPRRLWASAIAIGQCTNAASCDI